MDKVHLCSNECRSAEVSQWGSLRSHLGIYNGLNNACRWQATQQCEYVPMIRAVWFLLSFTYISIHYQETALKCQFKYSHLLQRVGIPIIRFYLMLRGFVANEQTWDTVYYIFIIYFKKKKRSNWNMNNFSFSVCLTLIESGTKHHLVLFVFR